jgi:hypothetical protein
LATRVKLRNDFLLDAEFQCSFVINSFDAVDILTDPKMRAPSILPYMLSEDLLFKCTTLVARYLLSLRKKIEAKRIYLFENQPLSPNPSDYILELNNCMCAAYKDEGWDDLAESLADPTGFGLQRDPIFRILSFGLNEIFYNMRARSHAISEQMPRAVGMAKHSTLAKHVHCGITIRESIPAETIPPGINPFSGASQSRGSYQHLGMEVETGEVIVTREHVILPHDVSFLKRAPTKFGP